jgi:YidC/Oxa1 family membrane protein insertase
MDKRFLTFVLISFVIVMGWTQFLAIRQANRPKPPAAAQKPAGDKPAAQQAAKDKPDAVAKPGDAKPGDSKPVEGKSGEGKPGDAAVAAVAPVAVPAVKQPARWVTLGSLADDPKQRMLVTLSSRGAVVQRVELNNPRYHDVDSIRRMGGYLGDLVPETAADKKGVRVNVVGPGTPAADAGLKAGDEIFAVGDVPTPDGETFARVMHETTKPDTTVKISYRRDGNQQQTEVKLRRHPMSVVQPEFSDPAKPATPDPMSFLMTLQGIGDEVLPIDGATTELAGVDMRTEHWETVQDPAKPNEVEFRYALPAKKIEVIKRYRLEPIANADLKTDTAAAYTLGLHVEVKNTSDKPQMLAYRLDGPSGLPVEGWWYSQASKIGREWFKSAGMRDVVRGLTDAGYLEHGMYTCTQIVDGTATQITQSAIQYVGVDAQYFTAAMIPQGVAPNEKRYPSVVPMTVGKPPADPAYKKTTNVSFRMVSNVVDAKPGETVLAHDFKIYLGPKVPDILAEYQLDDLAYYGYFGWVAKPLLAILHFFYALVGNYGIAIVMLTILVRSLMFPLSKKQAQNAAKMQELQPELKKIAEKYKKSPEERLKAQQDLWKKHNYSPLSGCLPIFIQLPIFMGLYRSLAVDIELRQAPLISENIRWASNLAAPDMLWYWRPFLPAFLTSDNGSFSLGPYLNLLPCVTIALFLIQQKMFMPPATDEQTAVQQKMIKYMMVIMCFFFFKVPGGLCIYFIASSIWSIAERQLLPKPKPAPIAGATLTVPATEPERKAKRK